MASCCETEESWNGRVRRISYVHKHTVTAGESKNPKDHRRENWDQPDKNVMSLRKPKREDTGTCENDKKEDSGTCDNTSEVSDNTTEP